MGQRRFRAPMVFGDFGVILSILLVQRLSFRGRLPRNQAIIDKVLMQRSLRSQYGKKYDIVLCVGDGNLRTETYFLIMSNFRTSQLEKIQKFGFS